MTADPRKTALEILLAWEKGSRTLDQVLEHHAREIESLSDKDKNLCNAMIFGVLRHREHIDWVIRACVHLPFNKIQTGPLNLLRIAVFQILYLDRVPDFAAINTAVDLAKERFGKKASGFINAVLRNAAKSHESIPLPDSKKEPATFLSVIYAMPPWLVKKWIQHYGRALTDRLCSSINTIPKIPVHVNTLKTGKVSLQKTLAPQTGRIYPGRFAENALHFDSPEVPVSRLQAFQDGLFQVQDEAAQLVGELLDPQPEERILDACAGLGGKTAHAAQQMKNRGEIIANDPGKAKLERLDQEMHRLGIDIVKTSDKDILRTTIKDFGGYFHRVLLDAPCSGLGVLRRNPDSKWKRKPKDILRLAAQQKKMLNAAASLVCPGGVLVYAVCSCEPEENEMVIEHFLKKRKDFSIDHSFKKFHDSPWTTRKGFIKTYPETVEMDGFFAARLKRKQPDL